MKRLLLLVLLLAIAQAGFSQMERERVSLDEPVDAMFKAPHVILMNSSKNLEKNTLHMMIKHVFDPVETGIQQLYGLDVQANIKLSLDYGVTDKLSVGISRSKFQKMYQARYKYTLFQQLKSGNFPVDILLAGNAGVNTTPNDKFDTFTNRMSYSQQAIFARKFSPSLSLQIAPTYVHYNLVDPGEYNDYFALGAGGRFKVTNRTSVNLEWVPVLTETSQNTYNSFSVGVDIETGSHVFQLFFTNSFGMDNQNIISHTSNDFFGDPFGQFRFGFNVNRIFLLGEKDEGLRW